MLCDKFMLGLRTEISDFEDTFSYWGGQTTSHSTKLDTQFLNKVIFEKCHDCYRTMPSLPQAAFAVHKVKEWKDSQVAMIKKPNEEKEKRSSTPRYDNNKPTQLSPVKYNEKLMNSIWGLYNRNSPHNFKKNNGADSQGGEGMQQLTVAKDLARYSILKPSPTYITYDIHAIDYTQLEETFKFSMA